MDESAARKAFEAAIQSHSPGFGTFFLARFFDLDIAYGDGTSLVCFPVRDPEARCQAGFLRKGRSICFLQAELFNSEGEKAVVASSTWRSRGRHSGGLFGSVRNLLN